jgi:hypothetical protein
MWEHVPGIATSIIASVIVGTTGMVVGFVTWHLWGRRSRVAKYLPLVLSDNPKFGDDVEEGARYYFTHQIGFRQHITRLEKPARDRSAKTGPGVELSRDAWRQLLEVAMKTIRKSNETGERHRPEELHLVFGTKALWNFALGSLLQNRHALVLYHFQIDGRKPHYHRIWQIDRSVKDLRSPKSSRPFEYRFLPQVINEPPHPDRPGAVCECLVFEMGANQIRDSVRSYRDVHLAGARLRVHTKGRNLPYDQPGAWRLAAAEIAHAICDQTPAVSEAADSYVFVDMPAVLALMAGDAIGNFGSRRLHLMQFDTHNKTYVEMLCLPDSQLSPLAG